jgi:hypothetical protein
MDPKDFTLDQWMQGISNAERAGDKRSADYLRALAQKHMTGEGTMTERIGAGAEDVKQNIARTFGNQTKEGLAEHNRIAGMADPGGWGRLGGQAMALAPTMLIPGAGTVAGSALIGAGTGALMEPEDPMKGALIGGATGGGVAKGLQMLPAAAGAVRDQLAKRTSLFPVRKQEMAEEAFRGVIPQGERAGVLADLQAHADPVTLPGFQQTTAGATRNPSLLEAERALRSQGQSYGEPIRRRAGDQAKAVQDAWEAEFGGGAKAAVEDVRDAVTGMHKEDMALHALPTKKNVGGVLDAFDAEIETAIGTHRDKLLEMRHSFLAAAKIARDTGSIEPLDAWRRVQLKQQLGQLYDRMSGNYAPDAAGFLSRSLQRIKPEFDATMDKLTGGGRSYSNLMGDYHQLSKEVGQAAKGEDWLKTLNARPEMAAEGVHDPVSVILPKLRSEFAAGPTPTTKYGSPTYNPQQELLLQQTKKALEDSTRATGARDIIPPGSSTVANLQPMNRVLQQAAAAQKAAQGGFSLGEGGTAGLGGLGVLMGHPLLGGAAIAGSAAKHFIADPAKARAMDDIAKRMVGMFANPREAIAALQNVPVPNQMKQEIMKRITYYASQTSAIGATNPQ